ncbi:hypothetical protein EK904_014274 [Melospiza melodia maxima]|nr:hypothetical protein EK904_014274 [Melospiza melodia maxima]
MGGKRRREVAPAGITYRGRGRDVGQRCGDAAVPGDVGPADPTGQCGLGKQLGCGAVSRPGSVHCREAINRLYEAVPGVKGIWKKKAPNKALFSILGKSNLHFAGMSIAVNISVDGLNLMIPTTRQIIANHHMQSISFASGGDMDTTDYVAYVAKDPINQRGDTAWGLWGRDGGWRRKSVTVHRV